MLTVERLSKWFDGVKALDGLSFQVSGGEILAVVGPNGSGKTTLLNLVSGLMKPTNGTISLLGESLVGKPTDVIAASGVARTFQIARVYKGLSVLDNLIMAGARGREGLAAALFGYGRHQEYRARDCAVKILERLGLGQEREKPAGQLSLGQMRRLEMARLLMQDDARLFLLDEPTGGLDPEVLIQVVEIIGQLRAAGGAIVVVEHNLNVVRLLADRVIVLHLGREIAVGKPEEVFQDREVREVYLGNRERSLAP